MANVGDNLRAARERRGLGLNQLARMSGVDRGNLSNYEQGKLIPKLQTLSALADAMNAPLKELFQEESNVIPVPEGQRRVNVLDSIHAGPFAGVAPMAREGEMHPFLLVDMDSSPNTFALKVVGDSMQGEFHDGDTIVIDPNVLAKHKDYVVAVDAGGLGTFKMFVDHGHDQRGVPVFELRPLNSKHPSRRSDEEPLKIVGVVVEHRRRLRLKK